MTNRSFRPVSTEEAGVGLGTFYIYFESKLVCYEYLLRQYSMYNIIWESLLVEPKFFREYYTQFSERYQKEILQGQEKSEFSQGDPEIISYILMGISNFIGIRYALFSKNEDLEAVSDAVISLLETGLFN